MPTVRSASLAPFTPAHLPSLVAFLNAALAGHRHWAPITEADFTERVLAQPGFDPRGLILALVENDVVGGIHAIRPAPEMLAQRAADPRHHIAWLAVLPEFRARQIGRRLLQAAENYLYYCPVYFASQIAPFYGILEKLWVPWYGSTEHMAISAVHDQELIDWLGKRGYQSIHAGNVSVLAGLQGREPPEDTRFAARGLRLEAISEQRPWQGDEPSGQLRGWGCNGGRRYQGLVAADNDRAVGSVVWYPLPDKTTAALAWIGLERPYRGLRYGSYLLDRALAEMAASGLSFVEAHVHTKDNPEAFALFRRRDFEVIDYWVNLVKT